MGRGRKKQPVLEAAAQIPHRPRELGFDAVAAARRRCRVMRFVQNQQAARQHLAQPLAQRFGVRRVRQQVVGHQKAAVGAPGVHAEAALAPHPRDVGAIENLEQEAEAVFEFRLPLFQHRGRRRYHDAPHFPPQQQFAGDEAGFDGFAEAGIVGDEEVHAGQQQRLAQRLHLVGVQLDAGAERRLEQIGLRGRGAVPAQRVEEGGKVARRIETAAGEIRPAFLLQDGPIQFVVPEYGERLALGIVVRAREGHLRRATVAIRQHFLHQPLARTHAHEVADAGRAFRQRVRFGNGHWWPSSGWPRAFGATGGTASCPCPDSGRSRHRASLRSSRRGRAGGSRTVSARPGSPAPPKCGTPA